MRDCRLSIVDCRLPRTRYAQGLWLLLAASTATTGARAANTPADRLVTSLQTDAAMPAAARELIRSTWEQCVDCDGAEFLAQALALLSPKFREGLEAYDAEEYARSAKIMNELRKDANLFLAVNAAVYEIKSLVAQEWSAEAGERITELTGDGGADLAAYTYHGPEIRFLRGFCLLNDLQYEAAVEALSGFLNDEVDAPPRLVISAKQMLAELGNREPGRIGEVVDLMQFSGRHLKGGDSGDRLQGRQQRIIDLLERLIKDAEQQEQSSKNDSSSGKSGGSSSRSPRKPMQQSQLPRGAGSGESLRDARRANPADMWGAMPPAERERVLQSLRDTFPSRYRRLVEQYYEELAKKP